MELTSLPSGSNLDVHKGIRFRIKRPNPDHVAASLLRSAYLLVFSLLGRKGYRYAESEALRMVREQIRRPDEKIIPIRIGSMSGLREPQVLVTMQFGQRPFFWALKINDNVVLLPCGGPMAHLDMLTQIPDGMEVKHEGFGFWIPAQFGNGAVVESTIRGESVLVDGDLIGTRGEISLEGVTWEWVMVEHQAEETLALPLGPKNSMASESGIGAIMMLGDNEMRGRGKDRSKFTKLQRHRDSTR